MSGKVKEFETLYESYHALVYRIAYIFTRNAADSEDITQELFVKLCYNSPDFNDERHERAWIIKVTQNLAKNYIKKAYKQREVGDEFIENHPAMSMPDSNLPLILALPEKYKMVILLYYYYGYSVKEISQYLKITPSNVKARLMRAREQLKDDWR
ncbi:MAG: sigma-70 family RNA polymerase sigma factor [Clostridia bacterium]